MEPLSPCTEAGRRIKGQRPLAFFFALLPVAACAQLTLEFDARQTGGQGLLSTRHWENERVRDPSSPTWNHAAVRAGARWDRGDWTWGAYKTKQVFFSGNTNLLILAAEDERKGQIDVTQLADAPVRGTVHTLEASTATLSRRWRPSPGMRLELTPQAFQIHDYQRTRADFTWQGSTTPSQLSGRLNRVGTRVYGFDANNRPDAGWGWGLDLKGAIDLPQVTVSAEVNNLLGQLRFSNVHYSDRDYKVSATNGKIIAQDAPSVSGRYGQASRTERLPTLWRIEARPSASPGWSAGLIGLDQTASVLAGYAWTLAQSQVSLTTIGLQNNSLTWSWRATPHISIGAAVTTFGLRHPEASMLSMAVRF